MIYESLLDGITILKIDITEGVTPLELAEEISELMMEIDSAGVSESEQEKIFTMQEELMMKLTSAKTKHDVMRIAEDEILEAL